MINRKVDELKEQTEELRKKGFGIADINMFERGWKMREEGSELADIQMIESGWKARGELDEKL